MSKDISDTDIVRMKLEAMAEQSRSNGQPAVLGSEGQYKNLSPIEKVLKDQQEANEQINRQQQELIEEIEQDIRALIHKDSKVAVASQIMLHCHSIVAWCKSYLFFRCNLSDSFVEVLSELLKSLAEANLNETPIEALLTHLLGEWENTYKAKNIDEFIDSKESGSPAICYLHSLIEQEREHANRCRNQVLLRSALLGDALDIPVGIPSLVNRGNRGFKVGDVCVLRGNQFNCAVAAKLIAKNAKAACSELRVAYLGTDQLPELVNSDINLPLSFWKNVANSPERMADLKEVIKETPLVIVDQYNLVTTVSKPYERHEMAGAAIKTFYSLARELACGFVLLESSPLDKGVITPVGTNFLDVKNEQGCLWIGSHNCGNFFELARS